MNRHFLIHTVWMALILGLGQTSLQAQRHEENDPRHYDAPAHGNAQPHHNPAGAVEHLDDGGGQATPADARDKPPLVGETPPEDKTPPPVEAPPVRQEPPVVVKPDKTNTSKRAFLGVQYEFRPSYPARGSFVTRVFPNTPARRAGLRVTDVITHLDGEQIDSLDELAMLIKRRKAGDVVQLGIYRNGRHLTVPVTLGDAEATEFPVGQETIINRGPQPMPLQGEAPLGKLHDDMREDAKPFLGLSLVHSEDSYLINGRKYVAKKEETGLLVERVAPGSTAAQMGMKKGDRLKAVNGRPVESLDDLSRVMKGAEIGEEVTVEFDRNGHPWRAHAPLGGMVGLDHNITVEEFEVQASDVTLELADEEGHLSVSNSWRAIRNGEAPSAARRETMRVRMENLSFEESRMLSSQSGKRVSDRNTLALTGFSLAPQPSTGLFRLEFDLLQTGDMEIRVFDELGRVIYSESKSHFSGYFQRDFDLSAESRGIYYLQVEQNGKSFARKIVTS